MNREQKAFAIAEIAANIEESQAIFAVDYRGISVPQVAELRGKLREVDASFKVVKNSLTERAADETGKQALKAFLMGPTALTFVRGDAALAAKAIADYARVTQLLPFKGGLMDSEELDAEQIRALSRLPSREVLYGQLVGVVASPLTGLVRTLNALIGGLAVALGGVREKKESGEIPAGDPPAAAVAEAEAPAAIEEISEPEAAPTAEAPVEGTEESGAAAVEEPVAAVVEEPVAAEVEASAVTQDKTEPASEPAQDDNQADVSADDQSETAEATKED
jgi:large subunit ribosomal protein L10